MDYIVCIPSYKRADVCKNKTMNMLKINNINPEKIYIYVADEIEYDIYKNTLDNSTYNKIIVGVKGLVSQRQFICEQWPEHQCIFSLDDDIQAVDLSISPFQNLDVFLIHAFNECIKQKAYIWGVYPVNNPFFMKGKKEIVTGLNYIIGAFYGFINRANLEPLKIALEFSGNKEDIERTLKYFLHDGIVLRFNKICFKTKYYGTDGGGLGTFKNRLEPALQAAKILKEHYSDYGDIKIRKNGMAEFVFKRKWSNAAKN
tara:strand:+ start:58 stop:831 length:774 start_codon:yes stop_codon:yes gene_type:complete